jgi:hypothetical protein
MSARMDIWENKKRRVERSEIRESEIRESEIRQ